MYIYIIRYFLFNFDILKVADIIEFKLKPTIDLIELKNVRRKVFDVVYIFIFK